VAPADFEDALDNTNEVDLTVTGRKSGQEISRPVWFVREQDKVATTWPGTTRIPMSRWKSR
jgi:hypothetical protein